MEWEWACGRMQNAVVRGGRRATMQQNSIHNRSWSLPERELKRGLGEQRLDWKFREMKVPSQAGGGQRG